MNKSYVLFGIPCSSNVTLGLPESKATSGKRFQVQLASQRVKVNPLRLAVTKSGEGCLDLNLPNFGIFTFNLKVKCLTLRLFGAQPKSHIQAAILNQGVPFALASMGELLLHASAIRTPKGAVVFMGRKGQGKSTIAARAAALGFGVLADDLVRIRIAKSIMVFPSFPEIRVFPNEARRHKKIHSKTRASPVKKRLDIRKHFYSRPLRLHKIVQLRKSKSGVTRSLLLENQNRFRWLMDNILHPSTLGRGQLLSRHFDNVVHLCRFGRFERVDLSHVHDHISRVLSQVIT